MYYDIHTHRAYLQEEKEVFHLISLDLYQDGFDRLEEKDCFFSVGVHPWSAAKTEREGMEKIFSAAVGRKNVLAIGECGLDRLCGVSMDRQEGVFEMQVGLSETRRKPLVIHCTKAFDLLLSYHKKWHPCQKWIVHGFRGKPMQMRQLAEKGIYLSFGMKYNSETVCLTPLDRMFLETDVYAGNIREVYDEIARTRHLEQEGLKEALASNFHSVFAQNK